MSAGIQNSKKSKEKTKQPTRNSSLAHQSPAESPQCNAHSTQRRGRTPNCRYVGYLAEEIECEMTA